MYCQAYTRFGAEAIVLQAQCTYLFCKKMEKILYLDIHTF